jgi:hypothetical protein
MGSRAAEDVLVEHVRRTLIHELGAKSVDVWRGRDGPFSHDVREIALTVVRALRPVVINPAVAERVRALQSQGVLPPPLLVDPNDW